VSEAELIYDKGIVYLNQNEAVVPVRVSNDQWAVIKINCNVRVLWRTPVNGPIKGLGKLGEKIVVIYVDIDRFGKNVHSEILEENNGKKTSDQIIYSNNARSSLEVRIQNRTEGEFNDVYIRPLAAEPGKF